MAHEQPPSDRPRRYIPDFPEALSLEKPHPPPPQYFVNDQDFRPPNAPPHRSNASARTSLTNSVSLAYLGSSRSQKNSTILVEFRRRLPPSLAAHPENAPVEINVLTSRQFPGWNPVPTLQQARPDPRPLSAVQNMPPLSGLSYSGRSVSWSNVDFPRSRSAPNDFLPPHRDMYLKGQRPSMAQKSSVNVSAFRSRRNWRSYEGRPDYREASCTVPSAPAECPIRYRFPRFFNANSPGAINSNHIRKAHLPHFAKIKTPRPKTIPRTPPAAEIPIGPHANRPAQRRRAKTLPTRPAIGWNQKSPPSVPLSPTRRLACKSVGVANIQRLDQKWNHYTEKSRYAKRFKRRQPVVPTARGRQRDQG